MLYKLSVVFLLIICIFSIFMSVITWDSLSKNQDSNETIEQAIARLITAHLADANAHIEAGESLYTHKQSEVIDHLASSIVEDKYGDQSVPGSALKYDKLTLEILWESLDAINQYTRLTGTIEPSLSGLHLQTGDTSGSVADVHAEVFSEGDATDYFKNPRFLTVIRLSSLTNQQITLTAGGYGSDSFGFKIVNGTLYAFHEMDGDAFTTDISAGLTLTNWLRYKAIYTTGSKIEFYIDDVLKATHTTNLPEEGGSIVDNLEWFRIGIHNTAAENKVLTSRYLLLQQDT